jgi:hypothetical protein
MPIPDDENVARHSCRSPARMISTNLACDISMRWRRGVLSVCLQKCSHRCFTTQAKNFRCLVGLVLLRIDHRCRVAVIGTNQQRANEGNWARPELMVGGFSSFRVLESAPDLRWSQ